MTDWCVGDLAVCVDARPNPMVDGQPLKEGHIYRVSGLFVERHFNSLYGWIDLALFIDGVPVASVSGAHAANRFRKIRPDTHEACEAEFVTLLKRTKRKVEA